MEGEITHRRLLVNGINMHIAEKGEGDVVLLIHGFPELWYSWRHQIKSLAARGYRAVAPDLRGFGDSDAPADAEAYTMLHVVGDLVALIDALGQDKVFVVGHDWGAIAAWNLCMFRPDKVKALVTLSVAFMPRNSHVRPVKTLRAVYGDDYYVCAFQEPGRMEAEFAQTKTALLMRKFLTFHDPSPIYGIGAPPTKEIVLPSWLSEEDVNYFASKFDKSGFTGGLNYYRALDLNWELTSPWTGVQIKVPVKFIVGDQDLTYNFPGVKDYIHKGGFKKDVPLLNDVIIMEGVGHFINQEKPQEIADHIYDFIQKF
ncbi:epoxide hydrolase 1-like [Typha angustifolia]|uniref:epoxide hydrolase 1-like n=1 Tax=Typha angustifolia TaxID=59011 RepID=UPI003C2C7785